MHEYVVQTLGSFVALLVIIDPFAIVPVYLSLTRGMPAVSIVATRRKAIVISLAILLTFAFTGMSVFKVFGITLPAFQIAGGILLLLLGIAQLNSKRERVADLEEEESHHRDDISVFPLALPLIAGPGAISTTVLYASRAHDAAKMSSLVIAIVASLAVTYVSLQLAQRLFKVLGHTGLNLMTRIMGIILTAVGVQFVLNGVRGTLVQFGFIAG